MDVQECKIRLYIRLCYLVILVSVTLINIVRNMDLLYESYIQYWLAPVVLY